jgi:hypothetical protein
MDYRYKQLRFYFNIKITLLPGMQGTHPVKRIKVMKKEVSCNGQFYVRNRVKLQTAAHNCNEMWDMAF